MVLGTLWLASGVDHLTGCSAGGPSLEHSEPAAEWTNTGVPTSVTATECGRGVRLLARVVREARSEGDAGTAARGAPRGVATRTGAAPEWARSVVFLGVLRSCGGPGETAATAPVGPALAAKPCVDISSRSSAKGLEGDVPHADGILAGEITLAGGITRAVEATGHEPAGPPAAASAGGNAGGAWRSDGGGGGAGGVTTCGGMSPTAGSLWKRCGEPIWQERRRIDLYESVGLADAKRPMRAPSGEPGQRAAAVGWATSLVVQTSARRSLDDEQPAASGAGHGAIDDRA